MKTEQYTTTVLTAAEGCVLTEAAEVDADCRTFNSKIYLAAGDSPENWCEVTREQADAMKAQTEEQKGR